MKKLAKRTFKGIEYIRLGSLPQQQADSLAKTLDPRSLIKIQMYDEVIEDCVLYAVYEKWYMLQAELAKQTPASAVKNSVSLT